jgi:hypothetical protein
MGRQWTAQNLTLTDAVRKMESQKKEADNAREELSAILHADKEHMSLNQSVSAVMLGVLNNRVQHGITVSFTTPAKLSGGGSITKLDSLAEDVPGTNAQSVRINISGTYETYQGLLGYLESFKTLPVAVVRLKVQDQTFEVAIRVYGNKAQ